MREGAVARFAAPIDRKLLDHTRLGVGFMLGLSGLTFATIGRHLANGPAWIGAPLLAIPLLLAVLWALAPRAFVADGGSLRIERLLWPISVPRGTIRSVSLLGEGALRDARRTSGLSGLFSYAGRYTSPSLGDFRLYARRWDGPLVLVITGEDRLVLAPADPGALVAELLASAPHLAQAPAAMGARRPVSGWRWAGLAALVFLPPVLVPTLFYPTWALAPVAIRVRGDAVHIARKHAKAITLPLAHIKGVERLDPDRLRGMRREAGGAYADVEYGTYRSAELGQFQLYAFRGSGYVLLEGIGGRVVVTPDDPDRFVEAALAGMADR
jgi:hypothetical protein